MKRSRRLLAAAALVLLAPSVLRAQDRAHPRVFPQPFNLTGQYSTVKIQPVPAGARVTLFSSDRRKVAQASVAGETASWDGRSSAGRRVAPGVFFYVVEEAGRIVAAGRLYVKQD